MHSIRRRLMYLFVLCCFITVISSTFFVNLAITETFKNYVSNNQQKRNERLVKYFEEVYSTDLKWTTNTGKELQHEGYMSNYCLTLLDKDKKEVWAMDPKELKTMTSQRSGGEYRTTTFKIYYKDNVVGYLMIGQYQPILISDEDQNFINTINFYIGISVFVTIIVSILISFYFSKQFSNPIKSVSETSAQLSEGNYKAKVETISKVIEINRLIKSINILGEKLEYQDELRKRLVSDISHEIRTPLNIFQNNLEAMIDGIFPPTIERLNSLNEEVIRFGKLLNNLDVLKQFEEEQTKTNFENINLYTLIENTCKDFMIHAQKKNIEIQFKAKKNIYDILGNKDDLKRVFINLLSNAIKFNRDSGKILVSMKQDNHYIDIFIKDTGVGIKKEDLPFVFERLYRGDKSRNEIEGTGLGLTIVKKIMILHSATIEVESIEDVGTTFILRFKKNK
ncbi:sensor histidine kinase [Anaeromicropila herbilytica]|uniref:histidine kinase n=1 Tax=Anaeromicropila herbilytica TaxID=2785025 RepID=A0A7R7EIX7_9FIRM|nr:HAMP domain-containing sensor histidine kinase [Anaeromicropila herbilytica]BCN29589.1 two-component sensor histidine kinase [Anaeromicropila herbilytica]